MIEKRLGTFQNSTPWIVLGLLLACLPASLARFAIADADLEGSKPAQWRLVWIEDPAHEAIVSWTTVEPGKRHLVRYKVADGSEEGTASTYDDGKYIGGDHYYHHVLLKHLQPATRYDVVIESDGNESPPMHFITAPDDDRPLKLLFGGDSRSGRDARRKINQMMSSMLESQPDIVALAHGGDYVVTGTKFKLWSQWMSDHELTVTKAGRLLPIIPARGNHDFGELFNNVFGFSAKNKNYYAASIGSQIRFVTLNSNISAGGDQAKWLEAELKKSRPSHRWLLAQYHRPVFPAVKSPGSGRQHWVPLFEKYNLDMACEADGHTIKRTPPIRNEKLDPTGVVYIGEGGLGVGQRTPHFDDQIFIDGKGDIKDIVLRDRWRLAHDGIVLVIVSMEKPSGRITSGPDIISRGFIFEEASTDVISEARRVVAETITGLDPEVLQDLTLMKARIRNTLKKHIYKTMNRRPMIVPIIFEV